MGIMFNVQYALATGLFTVYRPMPFVASFLTCSGDIISCLYGDLQYVLPPLEPVSRAIGTQNITIRIHLPDYPGNTSL